MTFAPFLPSLACTAAAKQETLSNGHVLPHQPLANGHNDINLPQDPIVYGDSTPLRALCTRLNAQIMTFLHEDVKTERLKATQAQTRISLQIIQEALDRYPQVLHFPSPVISSHRASTLMTLYPRHQPVRHLPLLQWWKRLSYTPNPPALPPLKPSQSTQSAPRNLHPAAPPFPSRRGLCFLIGRRIPPYSSPLLSNVNAGCFRRLFEGKHCGQGDFCWHEED